MKKLLTIILICTASVTTQAQQFAGKFLKEFDNDRNFSVVNITPEMFEEYKQIALKKGFRIVESGPFVRSSYCAEKHLI